MYIVKWASVTLVEEKYIFQSSPCILEERLDHLQTCWGKKKRFNRNLIVLFSFSFSFFLFVSAVLQMTKCSLNWESEMNWILLPSILEAASEHSFLHSIKNMGVNRPTAEAASGAFRVHSEEPEFPASVLFGLWLGLAFWGGCEHFVGVRQSWTLLAV